MLRSNQTGKNGFLTWTHGEFENTKSGAVIRPACTEFNSTHKSSEFELDECRIVLEKSLSLVSVCVVACLIVTSTHFFQDTAFSISVSKF